ncbi:alpha/beta fold hydrolase [Cryobacterium sp. TMT2-15-1]|uniref:alpha/beta fold hydrolase n=1 Tax=Cryobacterium sp. TMT2-15-1 TaxID=1259246 RepID=UPI00351A0B39
MLMEAGPPSSEEATVAVEELSAISRRNNVTVSGNPNGRAIVFAHGFGCDQSAWRLVTPAFLADYKVIVFDHVGAGSSDASAYSLWKYDSLLGYADDLLEILDELDVTDVVYVGHSVGGMIGVLAANRDPSRFGALVLITPSPRYINAPGYEGGFEVEDINSMLDDLDSNYFGWSSVMAPLMMGNPDRPELGDELTENFCSTDPTIARHFARVTFLSDNREDLPLVSTPTLILECSADIVAPAAVGRYVHQQIAGSTLVTLAATGHIPNLSAPDALADAILAYLK